MENLTKVCLNIRYYNRHMYHKSKTIHMKNFITTAASALVLVLNTNAQTTWNVDASHSKLRFSVVHMMVSETEGKFKVFDGKAVSKTDMDFTDADITFTADASSIDTDDPKRDAHLKSPDFFDVEKNPNITFKSTSMKPTGKGKTTYNLDGDLTMHGVTRRVRLQAI